MSFLISWVEYINLNRILITSFTVLVERWGRERFKKDDILEISWSSYLEQLKIGIFESICDKMGSLVTRNTVLNFNITTNHQANLINS
jgi:hypothetical protein